MADHVGYCKEHTSGLTQCICISKELLDHRTTSESVTNNSNFVNRRYHP
jgi:hypothetical protein